VTDSAADRGRDNVLQGEFGEAWVRGVASGCGLLQGHPFSLDLWKTDVLIASPSSGNDTAELTVRIQVKTTLGFHEHDDGTASFDLDAADYNGLTVSRSIRRLLAVIWLERDGTRIRLQEDGTLFVGHAAWMSLEDAPPTSNTTTVAVRMPLANTLDGAGFHRMLNQHGAPRSTPVPDVDPWGGS
jgi:hypothetical protein